MEQDKDKPVDWSKHYAQDESGKDTAAEQPKPEPSPEQASPEPEPEPAGRRSRS